MELYRNRRQRLLDALGGNMAVIRSRPEAIRNGDVHHAFRQESDLYYLTGFEEPEVTLVLCPGHPTQKTAVFLRPRDAERETWDGRRLGVEKAAESLGVDAAYPAAELDQRMGDFLPHADGFYATSGLDTKLDAWLLDMAQRGERSRTRNGRGASHLQSLPELLGEMRLRKGPEEIGHLRRANLITGDAHVACMRDVRPGMHEYELEAILAYHYRKAGSRRDGYSPIVASGANATILHYVENNRRIADGDLVLIDSGAESGHYTADVTRTFPANGKFTAEQKAVYEIVLAAQKAGIAAVSPRHRFEDAHLAALDVLVEGLLGLGFLHAEGGGTPSKAEAVEKKLYSKYYMHRTGHWLGMDVHDVGGYMLDGKSRMLEPGMVVTVEPGLYIPAGDESVPEAFRGIGVRIENDVAVTAGGCDDLSAAIPREIAEIESLHGG